MIWCWIRSRMGPCSFGIMQLVGNSWCWKRNQHPCKLQQGILALPKAPGAQLTLMANQGFIPHLDTPNKSPKRFNPAQGWGGYCVSWILQPKDCSAQVIEGGDWRVFNLNWFFYSSSPRKWDWCNEIGCVCLPIPCSSHPPNNLGTERPITAELDRGRRSQSYQIPASLMKAGSQAEETAFNNVPRNSTCEKLVWFKSKLDFSRKNNQKSLLCRKFCNSLDYSLPV